MAGLTYLVIIVLSILNFAFIESDLFAAGNHTATFNNTIGNSFLFRTSLISDIIMFAFVVILAVTLFILQKYVNRNLALIALFLRFGDGIIGGAILLLSGFIPLLLSNIEALFDTGQFWTFFVLFPDMQNAGMDIVIICMRIGAIIFFTYS